MAENLKQAPIPVVSRMMKIVNSDGTVTRSGQLLLEQLQAVTTTFGPHADRPAPGDVPDGALYVDSDYGVIYQNQGGTWVYIAGTMYGTLAPDQRPTDLGVNDAGFDFRVTDPDAANKGREFIWSAADWVETTPVQYGTHAARLAVPAAGILHDALWIETDRNNIVYQVQLVGGAPAWIYVTGAMYGTIIAVDQRPTGLGVNDTGLIFLSSDSTSVRWAGGNWVALDRVLDLGPAPTVSQLVVKANAAGAYSLVVLQPNDVYTTFDCEWLNSGWVARHATSAIIAKQSDGLRVFRSFGNTPGGAATPGEAMALDLVSGQWFFRGIVETDVAFYVGFNQVVKARMPAIAAPSGGTTIDTQARAAIQSILNTLSFAAGGHGLIG